MVSRLVPLLVVALLSSSVSHAQVAPCYEYTFLRGWDDTVGTAPLGAGGNGPEDIAWNPSTGTLFVAHDVPNSVPDILLEYDLQGGLVQANVNLPGVGGLCAIPGSANLLSTSGSTITEVDGTGTPVPGGVSVNVAGYGNIQDLEYDGSGALWIHDGNSGDFSTVNTSSGAATTRFVAGFGTQGFTFDANGHILAAAAFFNAGPYATGTLVKLDVLGNVLCAPGATVASPQLLRNEDSCAASQPTFGFVNGMTWITPLRELAVSAFFTAGGANVARFGTLNDAWLARIGSPGIRSDTLPFELVWSGDAVAGTAGFTLTVRNVHPGDTLLWGVVTSRDCLNPAIGSNGSILYLDITPASLLITSFFPASTSTFSLPLDLSLLGPSAAGVELYTQFAGTDITGPGFPALLTNALRVRFDGM